MTEPLIEQIKSLKSEATAALTGVTTAAELEQWRVQYVGRRGKLSKLLRSIKTIELAARRVVGKAGNKLQQELTQAYEEKKQEASVMMPRATKTAATFAATSPVPPQGHMHPLTHSIRKLLEIFTQMGFLVVEGPEVEEARYNFDLLNIPLEHPARTETDTFYLKDFPQLVLRTHVSPLQIRAVIEKKLIPPFRIMYFGPSYRSEKEDATHTALFYQYEFMVVSESITLAGLKGIAQKLYSSFFNQQVEIVLRPAYFPFVEPGFEVHVQDNITGKGGWLEMAGAGVVHPNVLRNINVDPKKYQGIALGGGVDRLAMIKYGIPDIRLLYSNNMQFLTQFSQ